MSAQNLLHAIPIEINAEYGDLVGEELLDYKAFLVLAIFRSMTLNIYNNQKYELPKIITNSRQVCGWLTTLFKTGMSIGYAHLSENTENKFMIFSHGGVTTQLLESIKTEKL